MSLQFIQNDEGKTAGVFIPINEWKQMKALYKNLEAWEEPDRTKEEILESIKKGAQEIKLVMAGKLKAKPARQLLDEL